MAQISRVIKMCSNTNCGKSYIWSSAKREWGDPYWCSPECRPKREAVCKHDYVAHTCTACDTERTLAAIRLRADRLDRKLSRVINFVNTELPERRKFRADAKKDKCDDRYWYYDGQVDLLLELQRRLDGGDTE